MLIVIDLLGDEEDVIIGLDEKPKENQEHQHLPFVEEPRLDIVPLEQEKKITPVQPGLI